VPHGGLRCEAEDLTEICPAENGFPFDLRHLHEEVKNGGEAGSHGPSENPRARRFQERLTKGGVCQAPALRRKDDDQCRQWAAEGTSNTKQLQRVENGMFHALLLFPVPSDPAPK